MLTVTPDKFDARMDGDIADRMKLEGKPATDTYLKTEELLGVNPKRAVVVEDALAGVEAGRSGAFGLVIGVDRKHDADDLKKHGATLLTLRHWDQEITLSKGEMKSVYIDS